MQNENTHDTGTLGAEVCHAVEQGRDVQERVPQLTLRIISARTAWRAGKVLELACGNNFCNIGSTNAAVLPVPVCAPAIRSLPSSANGMA